MSQKLGFGVRRRRRGIRGAEATARGRLLVSTVLTGAQSALGREVPGSRAQRLFPGPAFRPEWRSRTVEDRASPWLRTCSRPQDRESSEAAAPARCCRCPSSGLFLSSLSGFYRQLLVWDINCPDEFIDNFDVTEHRRNYPPVQNVKSEKKQLLRRDPTVHRHCGGSGPRHQQCGLLCLFS